MISIVSRLLKSKILLNPYKGIYTLANYDIFELASKIKKNSYVSFETVLRKEWIVFQEYWETIFLATDNTIEKSAVWYTFKCIKIKDDILYNPLGIIKKNWYSIATPERAICDRIYSSKNYYFDNLADIDKEKLQEISQIYNKRVILEVKKLINA